MLNKSNLHNYQEQCVKTILDKKKCALFLGLGLGKTALTLTAISDLLDEFYIEKVLIIAPLRVANTVWKQEALKWDHLKDLKFSICTGTVSERIRAVNAKCDIQIINRENIPWLIKNTKWKWDMVVVDESSSFKSHTSQRFKALKSVTKYIKSCVLLSGTPAPNGEMNLWSQIYLLDAGERLGKNISIFRKQFFTPNQYSFGYTINKDGSSKIKNLIKDVCVSMETQDYIDLPEKVSYNETIVMPPGVASQYKELEKQFILSLENGDITALNRATLSNKLLQMCNGAVYDENGKTHEIHSEKLDALKQIIEDNPNENILLAYNYKSDLERLKRAFPTARVLSSNEKDQDDWNAGKIKLLLTHPASAGHGLNLQKGGSVIIWFGLNWSVELYQQFNGRLYRQGQTKTVRIIHLVAKGGLDEKVMMVLQSKAKTQKDLLDSLKLI